MADYSPYSLESGRVEHDLVTKPPPGYPLLEVTHCHVPFNDRSISGLNKCECYNDYIFFLNNAILNIFLLQCLNVLECYIFVIGFENMFVKYGSIKKYKRKQKLC